MIWINHKKPFTLHTAKSKSSLTEKGSFDFTGYSWAQVWKVSQDSAKGDKKNDKKFLESLKKFLPLWPQTGLLQRDRGK